MEILSVHLFVHLSVITSYSFPSDSKLTQPPLFDLSHRTFPKVSNVPHPCLLCPPVNWSPFLVNWSPNEQDHIADFSFPLGVELCANLTFFNMKMWITTFHPQNGRVLTSEPDLCAHLVLFSSEACCHLILNLSEGNKSFDTSLNFLNIPPSSQYVNFVKNECLHYTGKFNYIFSIVRFNYFWLCTRSNPTVANILVTNDMSGQSKY